MPRSTAVLNYNVSAAADTDRLRELGGMFIGRHGLARALLFFASSRKSVTDLLDIPASFPVADGSAHRFYGFIFRCESIGQADRLHELLVEWAGDMDLFGYRRQPSVGKLLYVLSLNVDRLEAVLKQLFQERFL